MRPTFPGIDVGSSAVTLVLVDDLQTIVGSVDAPLEPRHPRPL